jgi:energy-coupling factor transporter transmembrane protein EcfT
MFTVIVTGLHKAENTALAIESRGFGAYPTYTKAFRWTATGPLLLLVFIGFAVWLIYWERMLR